MLTPRPLDSMCLSPAVQRKTGANIDPLVVSPEKKPKGSLTSRPNMNLLDVILADGRTKDTASKSSRGSSENRKRQNPKNPPPNSST